MTDLLKRISAALADRYRIESELGAGGMATVYLAEDIKHQRQVALKVLRPELAISIGPDRFIREIRIAAQLNHPHIVPLFDSGEADSFLYYVMPYIKGESLRERLVREGKIPIDEVVRLTDEIASALSYAHEQGIVHRDIKPENIMLAGGRAVVADFGIARAVSAAGDQRLTGTGLAIGTPAYMSPEQAAGSKEVDATTDVYALGCVVYEMSGGRPPFDGETPQELLAKHAIDAAPALRSQDPGIPIFLERAVEKALAKRPEDRFPSPKAFATALTSGTVVARVRKPRPWSRVVVATIAGAVLIALAGWFVMSRSPAVERLAVLPLTNLTNDPEQEYLVDGVHEALIGELAQLGIPVIARATMLRYRDRRESVQQIARELNVDALIEGSVFRQGDSLEIGARLIDPSSEAALWSRTFDGDIPNVVKLYRGFARAIAEQIEVAVSPDAEDHLGRTRSIKPTTYEAYLKGMYYVDKADPAAAEQGMAYLRQAVEDDPAEPLAWSGLAVGYVTLAHGPAPPVDALPLARAAAERALRLDSTLADTWATLAFVEGYYDWEWEKAERDFKRALALNPSLAIAHYWYAWQLALFDHLDEGIAEHRLAQQADPLNPLHTAWLGWLYFFQGRYDEAEAEARRSLEIDPEFPVGQAVLAEVHIIRGMNDSAVTVGQKIAEVGRPWIGWLGRIYAHTGHPDQAREMADEIQTWPDSPWKAFSLALVYSALEEKDAAYEWLNYERPHAFVPWIRVDPFWESLWDPPNDPRFAALLQQMHLPPREQ